MSSIESEIASVWYLNLGDSIVPDDFQPPPPADSPLFKATQCIIIDNDGLIFSGIYQSFSGESESDCRFMARESAVRQMIEHLEYAD